jgi:hypothetical protein
MNASTPLSSSPLRWTTALLGLLLSVSACSDASDDAACEGSCEQPDSGGRTDVWVPDVGTDADASEDGGGDDGDGSGMPAICEPNATECAGRAAERVCAPDGSAWVESPCPVGEICLEDACAVVTPCDPGPLECLGSTTRLVCAADGFTRVEEACTGGTVCIDGECTLPGCDPNSKAYIGCEFFAVDLPQDPDAARLPAYVTISNANDQPVSVTLTNMLTRQTFRETVDASDIASFALQGIQLDGTTLTQRSFRVESNLPVTVHQFNPRNNSQAVYSNDASLLLPQATLGTRYMFLGWPTFQYRGSTTWGRATATVVASRADTEVTITSPVEIRAGDDLPGIAANTPTTFALELGDVLNLETADGPLDLSGLLVESTAPVSVFSGHACANVPTAVPYCDHLEQQVYPVTAWGTSYLATKFMPRGTEDDVWRVLAAEDGTLLQTRPAIEGVDGVTLNAGQVLEFASRLDFEISGSGPISVAQFMVGSEYPIDAAQPCTRLPDVNCAIPGAALCNDGATAIGDPAFLLSVPTAQFLESYLLLTPADYEEDYANLIFPDGATLTLDGEPLDTTAATAIGSTGWNVLRQPMRAGRHEVVGTAAFGITAYGYDCNVSYAYPGGLSVEAL